MKTILIQLDTDPHPSSFDRVVAVDAGVDQVFAYGGVTPENLEPLVHGAIFTRGPDDLKHTAIFVGGSDVETGERVSKQVGKTFFGPMRVSVMMDSNGSNTTAAAAALAARKHLELSGIEALVLGGTGPVGQRVAELLALEGARVRIASRSVERAEKVCGAIAESVDGAILTPHAAGDEQQTSDTCRGTALIVAAGAAGVQLLSADQRKAVDTLQVVIDLNAVPPLGVEGVEVADKAAQHDGVTCYGAIGVGGTKMKIHKAAVQKLFESSDQRLDLRAIYEIGQSIASR